MTLYIIVEWPQPDIGLQGPFKPLQANDLSMYSCPIGRNKFQVKPDQHTSFLFLKKTFEVGGPQLQKDTGLKSFWIQIWFQINDPFPLRVLSNFCLIKFMPKCTTEAPEPTWFPFGLPWMTGIRLEDVQLHQITLGVVLYNFNFISYPST